MRFQRTIKDQISCTGIGLHSGEKVTMTLRPAPEDTGVVFVRKDRGADVFIKADISNVVDTRFATTLGRNGVIVQTVEHLLAALSGLAIDNIFVDLDTSEVPVMDGSATPFIFLLNKAGIVSQRKFQPYLKIVKKVAVSEEGKSIFIEPSGQPVITYSIDFHHPVLGEQCLSYYMSEDNFTREIARARTFGFLKEVELLREHGLAKGGSLDNAIVIADYRILNDGGLRYKDEFVRHKILDSIGDLSLIGMPFVGHLVASKSGHALNTKLVTKILEDRESWVVISDPSQEEEYTEKPHATHHLVPEIAA
ncbi:MAG: UDP-3-O-acyl-N-acetylglucosamine deacetylase [Nitrospirota bacterium]|nr:UDP-3-O-acyl-N-acetylglucosamine deacetylase [Nitrospirota bacterium]